MCMDIVEGHAGLATSGRAPMLVEGGRDLQFSVALIILVVVTLALHRGRLLVRWPGAGSAARLQELGEALECALARVVDDLKC